jgi:hypothetical protein
MKRHWQEKEEAFTQACEEEPGLGREAETERSESRQQNKCSKRNERERRTGREIVGRRKQGKRRWKKKKNRAGEGQREPTKPTRVHSHLASHTVHTTSAQALCGSALEGRKDSSDLPPRVVSLRTQGNKEQGSKRRASGTRRGREAPSQAARNHSVASKDPTTYGMGESAASGAAFWRPARVWPRSHDA